MRPFPHIAIFTIFCIGLEAIVGLCLGLSNGLSETHKTVLVGFIVGYPVVTLLIFLTLLARAERQEAAWYYGNADELSADPAEASVNAA